MFLDFYVKFIFTLFIIKINNEEISKQSIRLGLPQNNFTASNSFCANLETSYNIEEPKTIQQKQQYYNFLNVSNDMCLEMIGIDNTKLNE